MLVYDKMKKKEKKGKEKKISIYGTQKFVYSNNSRGIDLKMPKGFGKGKSRKLSEFVS